MRYRIIEFNENNADEKGNRFFLEIGEKYKEKYWAFIYITKIRWEIQAGYKTWDDALKAFQILKSSEPKTHNIK